MAHSIKNLIKNSEKLELTGKQMELITEGKCRVLAYEELESCNNIDDCFKGKEGLIILYQKTNSNGHWCLLFKENANTLNFFDPYNFQMDEELKFSDYNLSVHNGVKTPHLTTLIKKSNYKLNQNKTRFQKMANDINTCGRHVCVRFRMRSYSNKEYDSLFKGVDADFYVSALTILYSNFED
jgi:hypothetical protein